MAAKTTNIYQFKITLKYTKPKIWRRIQVPEKYSFADLHFTLQDVMGWMNCHLHQFIINPKFGERVYIGVPYNDGFQEEFLKVIDERKVKIAKYFVTPKDKMIYEYDFGDGWEHEVLLEKILTTVVGTTYPRCIAGKRACPPEDCGGVGGYESLLEIMADPDHEEYKERMEWLEMTSGDFNPEEFDPKLVRFGETKDFTKDFF